MSGPVALRKCLERPVAFQLAEALPQPPELEGGHARQDQDHSFDALDQIIDLGRVGKNMASPGSSDVIAKTPQRAAIHACKEPRWQSEDGVHENPHAEAQPKNQHVTHGSRRPTGVP